MGVPYQAIGDALAEAFARVPDERLAAVWATPPTTLRSSCPGWLDALTGSGIDRAGPELIAPDQLGRRVVESILGALERLADGGVTVLVARGCAFADPATRGLVEALQTVGRSLPVCLVLSYQADELHRRHPVQRAGGQAG